MPLYNPFVPAAGANIRYSDPDTLAVDESIIPRATDTYDLGSSTRLWRKGYLSELEAVLFAENTITLLGGWFYVTKDAGTLEADVVAADTTIDFGKAMTVGHFVIMRASLKVEYVQVGALVSGTTYNVTRDLDGTGANDWPAGTPFAVLGTTGDGRIELNAYDTPRISMLRQGATYNAQTELVRIGDLNGWGPVSGENWGWAVGDYSGNEFAYYTPADGLTIRGTIRADDGYLGTLSIDGLLSIGASGELRQGTGTLGTDFTGLRIWRESDIGRIAGYNNNVLQWYAGTDGKLYAGAGAIFMDATGQEFQSGNGTVNQLRWQDAISGEWAGRIYAENGFIWVSGLRETTASWAVANAILHVRDTISDPNIEVRLGVSTDDGGYASSDGEFRISEGKKLRFMPDVNVYRSAADLLKTDDGLVVALGLNVGSATGAGAGEIKTSGQVQENGVRVFTTNHFNLGSHFARASAALTLTTSAQDITGCSLSLAAGTYLIIGVFDVYGEGANDAGAGHIAIGSLVVDTTEQSGYGLGSLGYTSASMDRHTVTQVWAVTLAATTTCKLQGKKSGGTGSSKIIQTHTAITAIPLLRGT